MGKQTNIIFHIKTKEHESHVKQVVEVHAINIFTVLYV